MKLQFLKSSLGFDIWTLKIAQKIDFFLTFCNTYKYFVNSSTTRCFLTILLEVYKKNHNILKA